MTSQQSVAVIGAGGPSGALIVDRLLAENIQTIAVVRSPAKYADRWPADHKKLKVVQGDVTDAAGLTEAVKNCTHIVFAASGQTYFSAKSVDFEVRSTAFLRSPNFKKARYQIAQASHIVDHLSNTMDSPLS